MGSVTCPATPTSTWTGVPALPATVTISSISRGSGVTCASAANGINGSGFNTASANAGFSANKYYTFTITNDISGSNFDLSRIVWLTAVSGGGSCNFTIKYSNNGGPITDFGTPAQTNTSSNTFNGLVTISPGTSAAIYAIPHETALGTTTVRFINNSTTTLPVELSYFDGKLSKNVVNLSFSTATETNNSHFAIERSADARAFSEIGQVRGAGTTQEPQSYTYTDERPLAGINYYRLRQVDYDGTESFSPVVSVVFGKQDRITLAPSPATDRVRIQLDEALRNDGLWQVYDNTGRQVLSGAWEAETADYELDVNTLPEGMYTFRLVVGASVQVKQFRKL